MVRTHKERGVHNGLSHSQLCVFLSCVIQNACTCRNLDSISFLLFIVYLSQFIYIPSQSNVKYRTHTHILQSDQFCKWFSQSTSFSPPLRRMPNKLLCWHEKSQHFHQVFFLSMPFIVLILLSLYFDSMSVEIFKTIKI